MHRRTFYAALIGAALGAIFGLAVVALAAGRVFGGGVQAIEVPNEPARATFMVSQAALYVLIVAASAAGGAVISAAGFAVGRLSRPDTERFPLGWLSIVAALTGAMLGFATARVAIGVGGTIADGVVSLSVFRAAMVAIITGGFTGAVLSASVERFARPEVIGLSGAAWPSSPVAFLRDATAAIGLPAIGIGAGLAIVYGLSRVLLEADKTTSLVVFGGAAALILAGGAAIAGRGGRD